MIDYVIYNKELGLFFSGFNNGTFSKYIQNAKLFFDFGYCHYYMIKYRQWFNGFKIYSFLQISKELLYA